jgi:hypothetical protein
MNVLQRNVALLLVLGFSTGYAQAGGGHHHHGHSRNSFGVYIGAPWAPWGYPPPVFYQPPYYYPPRVIVVPPPQPPVYIEQAPAYNADQYWYFCQQSNAYYPQVNQCPGGWVRVPPRQ